MAYIDHAPDQNKVQGGNGETWKRGAFMLIILVMFGMAQSLLFMTAIIQFFWLLFTKQSNALLARFGSQLALWLAEAAKFLTCAAETKPFPWTDWPRAN